MKLKYLCLASGIALLLAIPTGWPYDYYILLRWFISISSLVVAYGFHKSKFEGWALIFVLNTILFNPIVPIYLEKGTWVLIDLVSAAFFFLAAFAVRGGVNEEGN